MTSPINGTKKFVLVNAFTFSGFSAAHFTPLPINLAAPDTPFFTTFTTGVATFFTPLAIPLPTRFILSHVQLAAFHCIFFHMYNIDKEIVLFVSLDL